MLEAVIKQGVIFYVMGVMLVIGIAAKVISHFTTGKMVRAAGEIQKSNHRLMRLVKAKFEHASMVSDKVQNVEVFVKKYLYEYKVFGVHLSTWQSLPKKMAWLIAAIGIAGSLISFQALGMGEETFRYICFTGIFAVALFSIHILSDEKTKWAAAENYMVDYLENVCLHRYEKAGLDAQKVTEAENAEAEPLKAETDENVPGALEMQEKSEISKQAELTKERVEQEMRIRAILEEFLA